MSRPGADYELPPDKDRLLDRARRIEWLSIVSKFTIIVAVALVMGSSQAMKALWVEDTASLIPSIAFLVGAHFRKLAPTSDFPYGYRRAVLIAFLSGAVTLFLFGIYIAGDSLLKLLHREHPTIQSVSIFNHDIWLGWLMIVVLIYSVIPPFFLGRVKYKIAAELHDKVLYISGTLDKGDWLAGLAGIAGILGIALGFWWADAVAAAIISIEIVEEGYVNLRSAVAQLMHRRPTDMMNKRPDPITERVREELERLEWVAAAGVRLREDGDVLSGELFIKPKDERDMLSRIQEAQRIAQAVDWRLHDLSVMPVRELPSP